MTLTTLEDLRRAVLAAPAEDTPRAMFADFLAERGEGVDALQAEFVKTQLELSRTPDSKKCPACGGELAMQIMSSLPPLTRCRDCPLTHGPFWADVADRSAARSRLAARERELLRESYRWLDARAIDLVVIDDHGPDSLLVLGQERPGRPWTIQARLERGFVAELRCPAEAFLKHADALIWHPKQTVDCPECADVEHNYPMHMQAEMFSRCSCSGTGSVARTCPPTAQPITKVTLTTAPAYEFPNDGRTRLLGRAADHWVPRGEGHDHSVRGVAKTLCELEWPGVEFEISSGPLAY